MDEYRMRHDDFPWAIDYLQKFGIPLRSLMYLPGYINPKTAINYATYLAAAE